MPRKNITFVWVVLIAALMSASLSVGGCSMLQGDRDTDRSSDSSRDKSSAIPDDARMVDEGVGRLMYTPRHDGRIYVYDATDRRLVFSGRMNRAQEFRLVPAEDRATVDDKVVYDKDLGRQHEHRLYFSSEDEGRRSDRGSDGDSELPRGAARVAEGRGVITYHAHESGRAYVYDPEEKHLIVTAHLRNGQSIRVDPDKDRVTVDGKTVFDSNLERSHEHRIYFDKD